MRRVCLLVFVTVVLLQALLFSRDPLARIAWHQYGFAYPALLLNRSDAGLAMELGNYYFNGTIGRSEYDLPKAERAYRKAVELSPDIQWGHYQLARLYFVKGDAEQALAEVNAELNANPDNLRALYIRGLIYGFERRFAEAATDYDRFTRWAPTEWAGYNDYAWVLLRDWKFAEAKAVMQRAFANVPHAEENPWLWNSLGLAELNLGEYGEALKSFTRAYELAQGVTTDAWVRAYPGNDPAQANAGIAAFKKALEDNIEAARTGDKAA